MPNKKIESDTSAWRRAGLKIKPLELILNIIKSLHQQHGETNAYLTPFELQKIVIPLAGDHAKTADYLEAIMSFRQGKLDVGLFPDCAPGSNDRRMAREFLLFLSLYGFCRIAEGKNNDSTKFFVQSRFFSEISEITSIKGNVSIETIVQEIRDNPVIMDGERRKILSEILARPQQAKFRKQILREFGNKCVLTGEGMNIVLEACHLIPVKHRGNDSVGNGLCLRADIHILFDSKHIRLRPDGGVEYSSAMKDSRIYSRLPTKIEIPSFTSHQAVRWRYDYY